MLFRLDDFGDGYTFLSKTECLITLAKTLEFAMIRYGKYTEYVCSSVLDCLLLYIFKRWTKLPEQFFLPLLEGIGGCGFAAPPTMI